MREECKDRVTAYIRRLVDEFALERGMSVMEVMEDFAAYLDRVKRTEWSLSDIIQADIAAYYEERYARGDRRAGRHVVEIQRFLQFAEWHGWRMRRDEES